MSRRKIEYTVAQEGRDLGKTFVITEMSAVQAEDWQMGLAFALANTGVPLVDALRQGGMAGIAQLGPDILTYGEYPKIRPFLQTLWECITYQKDPGHPPCGGKLRDSQVEEPGTITTLKIAAFQLHTGFYWPGAPLTTEDLKVPPG